jgi:phosphatidylserine decarboxylase
MRIPITRYGLPQVAVFPAVITALMAAFFVFFPRNGLLAAAEIILFLILVWALMFFRHPQRVISHDEYTLLSPADGTITEISETESPELGGKALRIGLFLSIFNVHINRIPCSVRIESVNYKKGKFKNAMSGESGKTNESNSIVMTRLSEPGDKIMVRQVSGAIARRIVCEASPGREYTQGAVFGMIKFGSRTELLIPLREGGYDISVKIGDKVNAGLSPLIVYRR